MGNVWARVITLDADIIIATVYIVVFGVYAAIIVRRRIANARNAQTRKTIQNYDPHYGLFRRNGLGKRMLEHSWWFGMIMLIFGAAMQALSIARIERSVLLDFIGATAILMIAVCYFLCQKPVYRKLWYRARIFFMPLMAAYSLGHFLDTLAKALQAVRPYLVA